MSKKVSPFEPQRRLSPWRVLLAILIITALGTGSTFAFKQWNINKSATSTDPWFAAYVDVTSTPTFAFEQMGSTPNKDAVLSFVVSSPSNPCTPTWGGAYTLEKAGASLDLDRRIARLQQQGGNVAISFGGLNNHELAVDCTDNEKLLEAYRSVINRYKVDTIDLDMERSGLETAAVARRASVLAKLQSEQRSKGKKLAIWATLPVTPQGMDEKGTDAIAQFLTNKVDLAGVNAMTMDYGASRPAGQSMQEASQNALIQTQRQLGILYQNSGLRLSSPTLWSKIGMTPMIGQNDEKAEVFTLADAEGLNRFALSHKIGRASMWSANRDLKCGENYVDVKVVSDSCSGVNEAKQAFAAALSAGFRGSISLSAGLVTKKEQSTVAAEAPDDPKTSPYQIWSETGAYLQGTKVVWHHYVYEAKWWTQGDTPDNPVLQTYQTPWELKGPVLPDEKPIPQATLAPGTYPEWNGSSEYDAGQRVLFNGVPYQAKWWNKASSPAAASSNPTGSPWIPLTQTQINEIESGKK